MILMKNRYLPGVYLNFIHGEKNRRGGLVGRLSAYKLGLCWFESGCRRGKESDPHEKIDIDHLVYFSTKIDKVEQTKEKKLDRSASKLGRPTPEMAGMHQPSAFSRNI